MHLDAGQYPQAIAAYLKVLEYDADNITALNNVAWLYQDQGNYAEGVKYAERVHALVPGRPEVIDTLGWLLVQWRCRIVACCYSRRQPSRRRISPTSTTTWRLPCISPVAGMRPARNWIV